MTSRSKKALEFWSERELLIAQRQCLYNGIRAQREQGKGPGPRKGLWPGNPNEDGHDAPTVRAQAESGGADQADGPSESDLPRLLHDLDVVYRFTRGINDLVNVGIGYGELNREVRCVPDGKGALKRLSLTIRRTRTGRQPIAEPRTPEEARAAARDRSSDKPPKSKQRRT